jgi:protein subunit release factor B
MQTMYSVWFKARLLGNKEAAVGLRQSKLLTKNSAALKEAGLHRFKLLSKKKNHSATVVVNVYRKETNATKIKPNDLHWSYFRGSGPGGQHRNKKDTAVRLKHKPTKTQVEITRGRSQSQNKELALKELTKKLDNLPTTEIERAPQKIVRVYDQITDTVRQDGRR